MMFSLSYTPPLLFLSFCPLGEAAIEPRRALWNNNAGSIFAQELEDVIIRSSDCKEKVTWAQNELPWTGGVDKSILILVVAEHKIKNTEQGWRSEHEGLTIMLPSKEQTDLILPAASRSVNDSWLTRPLVDTACM